jgi:hypothetical protein
LQTYSRQMNTAKLKELEHLLTAEGTEVLRLVFLGDEIYELTSFSVAEDADEEYPHGTASVIQPISIPEHKRKFFKPRAGIFFSLNDVVEVRDSKTNERIFCAEEF